MMPEELSERLGHLEAAVHRAAELISRLKAEKTQLAGELEAQRAELARLRQERREVLAHVDGILKELDSLELG